MRTQKNGKTEVMTPSAPKIKFNAARLRTLMTRAGWRKCDLARYSGVPVTTVADLFAGSYANPHMTCVVRIIWALRWGLVDFTLPVEALYDVPGMTAKEKEVELLQRRASRRRLDDFGEPPVVEKGLLVKYLRRLEEEERL